MSVDAMIRKLVYSFWTRLHCSDNAVVHSFLNSGMFSCSQIVRRWHAILFNILIVFILLFVGHKPAIEIK